MLSKEPIVKTALRLPKEVHQAVHKAKAQSDRSYNGEIVHQLRKAYNLIHLQEQPNANK